MYLLFFLTHYHWLQVLPINWKNYISLASSSFFSCEDIFSVYTAIEYISYCTELQYFFSIFNICFILRTFFDLLKIICLFSERDFCFSNGILDFVVVLSFVSFHATEIFTCNIFTFTKRNIVCVTILWDFAIQTVRKIKGKLPRNRDQCPQLQNMLSYYHGAPFRLQYIFEYLQRIIKIQGC